MKTCRPTLRSVLKLRITSSTLGQVCQDNTVSNIATHYLGETAFMRMNIGTDGSMLHVWTDRHSQSQVKDLFSLFSDLNVAQELNGVNVCGSDVAESKFGVGIDTAVPHNSESLRVGFGSTIESEDPFDVSWGVWNQT